MTSNIDAIIIAGSGADTFSGTNLLKLKIDDRIADIQSIKSLLNQSPSEMPAPSFQRETSWKSTPKLSGIFLLSFLQQHGFNCALIDNYIEQKDLFSALLACRPTAIIISTTFISGKQPLKRLVDDIRKESDTIPIIAGGPFIHTSYHLMHRSREADYLPLQAGKDFLFLEVSEEPQVDLYIFNLRGEYLLPEILRKLRSTDPFATLPNTARLIGTEYSFGPKDDRMTIPSSAINWHCLPDEIFASKVMSLQGSNGCQFNCAFCNFVKDRSNIWITPVSRMIEEMSIIQNRGIKYAWFVDDNFRLGQKGLRTVCEQIIDTDLNLKWMTMMRTTSLDQMDLDLLKAAGCMEIQLGIESADDLVLQNMNKKNTLAGYDRVLSKLLSAGINCSCFLIFGFPGETDASARRTIEFMQRHDQADYPGSLSWSIYPFVVAPLSPVFEPAQRRKYGIKGYMRNWEHKTMNAKQAARYTLEAFLSLDNSGPIYREDNLELLSALTPKQRKAFHRIRNQLSRQAYRGNLKRDVIRKAFAPIFSENAEVPVKKR